jgi:septum formation protein
MTASNGDSLRLVLASASPRRRELLTGLGLVFDVQPAHIDETPLPGEEAAAMVARLARDKAAAVAAPARVTLAADSVVGIDGQLLGKPRDAAEATEMLRMLSGRTHVVSTGIAVAVVNGGEAPREAVAVVTTEVTFVALSDADVSWYVATGEPLDKAGAYGLQGQGARWVRSIAGSPTNVIGLPLPETVELAARLGIDLTRFRK